MSIVARSLGLAASRRAVLVLVAGPVLLSGCGGGDLGAGGGSTNPGPARRDIDATFLAPVDDVGRLTVKGVALDTSDAQFLDADGKPVPADEIDVGMMVEVDALLSDPGEQGVARRVKASAALQGPVESVSTMGPAPTLVALGTTVRADASTTLDGIESLAALQPGDPIRIHGLHAADGTVTATRIERHSTPFAQLRLQGPARNFNPGAATFDLGGLRVAFAGAVVQGVITEGAIVTARSDRPPVGGQWVVTAVEVLPMATFTEGAVAAVEGFVSRFRSVSDFQVGGVAVDASRAAVAGAPEALRDGVRVTVRGTWRAGRIEAASIGLIASDQPRTIVNIGPLIGTPFWWGPSFWGPGWLPWVPGTFVGASIIGAPGFFGPTWLARPLPPRPPSFVLPGVVGAVPGVTGGVPGVIVPGVGVGTPGLGGAGGGLGTAGFGGTGTSSVLGGASTGFGSRPPAGGALPGLGVGDSPNFGQPANFGQITRPVSRPTGGWWGSRGRVGGGRR